MLQLINDKELMGSFKNSGWVNATAYTGTGVLIVLNAILIIQVLQNFLK
jgi:Mn2+/Fe2+ NRAMP family transporter